MYWRFRTGNWSDHLRFRIGAIAHIASHLPLKLFLLAMRKFLAKLLLFVLHIALMCLTFLAYLLYKLAKKTNLTLKTAVMRIAGPQSSADEMHGFYLVPAQPQVQVSPQQWRWITIVSLILVSTNLVTYFWSDSSSSATSGFISEVKRESLYLIDKASLHVTDVHSFEFKVRQVSRELDIPPEWLMSVMYLESKFDPSIQNLRGSGATGLIQFMVPAVQDLNDRLGTTYYMSDIRRMSAQEQLNLVHAYLQTVRERYGEYNSLTDLYLGIFYPKAINQDMCYALFAKGTRSYNQNRGLDENKDGVITNSDIDRRLKRMFPTAYMMTK